MSTVGRNEKCPCGSGKKYKKCHMDIKENPGVLKKVFSIDPKDNFVQRFIFGLGNIRSCAIQKEKTLEYDEKFQAVFQNLYEMKIAKFKFLELLHKHKEEVSKKKDGKFHGNQIDVENPIDEELNFYFKDFFIRGYMATRGLISVSVYLGHNIEFFFSDDEKKFNSGAKKFPIDSTDQRFTNLHEFIKMHQTNWYKTFRELRRKIEHDGWRLPHVNYIVHEDFSVEVRIPPISNLEVEDMLETCWINIVNLCEEITVFLLSQKLPKDLIVVKVPETERVKHNFAQYIVSHKSFPGIPIHC